MKAFVRKGSIVLTVLALLLSFAALPVGADVEPMDVTQPTVSVDPTTAGKAAEYVIGFRTSTNLKDGGCIGISLPAPGGSVGDVTIEANGSAVDVDSVDVVTTTDSITMTISITGTAIADGSDVVVTAADIENPGADTYTLWAWTSAEPNPVESEEYTITEPVPEGPVDVFDAGENYLDSYDTISDGVVAVPSGGWVKVAAGTYTETVVVDVPGVTVMSYDGAEDTIIEGDGVDYTDSPPFLVTIITDNVTFEGFTVQHAQGDGMSVVASMLDADDAGISLGQDGDPDGAGVGIHVGSDQSASTTLGGISLLDNRVIENETVGIQIENAVVTVQGNVVSGNVIGLVGDYLFAPTIVDNVVSGNHAYGALLRVFGGSLIEGNTFSNNGAGAKVGGLESLGLTNTEESEDWGAGLVVFAEGDAITETVEIALNNGPVAVEIVDNAIGDNVGLGLGLVGYATFDVQRNVIGGNIVGIVSDAGYDTANIHYNDIVGNGEYGLVVLEESVNAQYNWWGAVGGPSGERFMGLGDAITATVPFYYGDCDPWLTKNQAKVVGDGVAWFGSLLELDEGWNTASMPVDLNEDGDSLGDIVAMGTFVRDEAMQSFVEAAWWYDATAGYWKQPLPDTKLVPGLGLYIKTTQPIEIPVLYNGKFGAAPSRSLEAGWNLVGSMFGIDKEDQHTCSPDKGDYGVAALCDPDGWMEVENALASVEDQAANIISPSLAGQEASWSDVYPTDCEDMYVGEAYWIFMKDAANLAGLEVTPFGVLPGLLD